MSPRDVNDIASFLLWACVFLMVLALLSKDRGAAALAALSAQVWLLLYFVTAIRVPS